MTANIIGQNTDLGTLFTAGAVQTWVMGGDGAELTEFLADYDWESGEVASYLASCDPDDLAALVDDLNDSQLAELLGVVPASELEALIGPEAAARLRARLSSMAAGRQATRRQTSQAAPPRRQATQGGQSIGWALIVLGVAVFVFGVVGFMGGL